MTEQEYCDTSDLQLCRASLGIMRMVHATEGFNEARKRHILINLDLMVSELENKVQVQGL